MNIWTRVHWEGVYSVGECLLEVQFKIDQSKMTKSHMLNTSLRLTNHK